MLCIFTPQTQCLFDKEADELRFCFLVITELEQETLQRDVNSHDGDSDVATTADDATNKALDVTARAAADDNSDEGRHSSK